MPTAGWIAIIVGILLLWYFWNEYGALYRAARDNPAAVGAGQSVARYAEDVQGLINAFQSASDEDGSFMSRLGAFFGQLPK
jgi:hypothetical protein